MKKHSERVEVAYKIVQQLVIHKKDELGPYAKVTEKFNEWAEWYNIRYGVAKGIAANFRAKKTKKDGDPKAKAKDKANA